MRVSPVWPCPAPIVNSRLVPAWGADAILPLSSVSPRSRRGRQGEDTRPLPVLERRFAPLNPGLVSTLPWDCGWARMWLLPWPVRLGEPRFVQRQGQGLLHARVEVGLLLGPGWRRSEGGSGLQQRLSRLTSA